jgi:hypothetical protein
MSNRTYKVSELRRREADRRGGDIITLVTDDGKPHTFPAPGFWSDEVKAKMGKGDVAFVRALMGEKGYEAFHAAGGQSDDVSLVVAEYRRTQGADLGESSAS